MILLDGKPINVTTFPDHTSQVWKVEGLEDAKRVEWRYENDSEFLHLIQLIMLLEELDKEIELFIPFMPYARQDKPVSNETTFAGATCGWCIGSVGSYISKLTTVDVHSDIVIRMISGTSLALNNISPEIDNIYPQSLIDVVNEYDVVIFPDEGAKERYGKLFNPEFKYSLSKVRDQLTGEILCMRFNETDVNLRNKRCIIVDDICDGGRTFVGVSDTIDTMDAECGELALCVTHGIFSNMSILDSMLGRHFDKIYTTDSLYRGMTADDWRIDAEQSVKYNTLYNAMLTGKLSILSCDEGVVL